MSESRRLTVALIVLTGLACFYLLYTAVLPATRRELRSFSAYYTASSLLVGGQLGPDAYNDRWFNQRLTDATSQNIKETYSPSLPTMALLALPLVWLPAPAAHQVWLGLHFLYLLLAVGGLILILRRVNHGQNQPNLWLLLATVSFLFPGVAANFYVSQTILLFFLLFVVALWGLVTDRAWLAGIALGLALGLKTTGVSLWLLLLIQGRWRALGWGLATV
ncbi:MAG: glycosyltransferase family 87 protein, partial [Anaerolineae bacterium]|nr:glycosyltransferase family 87 protein [Anaerolineae bacterium]